MMNLLRRKLEAITGSNWRESGMTIRPQNFSGSECYIALGVETRPYVNGKGQKMLGTNNTVLAYLRPGEEFDFRTVPVAAAEQGSVGDYGV
jgi:hypothetical protein